MATTTTATSLFALFLVLVFNSERGSAQCTVSSISVEQTTTGAQVKGQPQYQVVLSNGCVCAQSNLIVACLEFKSTEWVNPAILRPVGGRECLVNNGRPLAQGDVLVFTYASPVQYTFNPVSSQISC